MTTVAEWATCCAHVCCTTHIGGFADVAVGPRSTLTSNWATPSCTWVARPHSWLARAICLRAARACPTVLRIASALAGASAGIQFSTILALSHALACGVVPRIHRRGLAKEAIAVFDGLFQCQSRLVEPCEIHIRQEIRNRHEGISVCSASCLNIATLQPGVHNLLSDARLTDLTLKRPVSSNGYAGGPL